jgi:hypothetical protein
MALTFDDKKQILGLKGQNYSDRKIASKTGHSETTVRKVIDEAREKILSLGNTGADKIAEQLSYPLEFVKLMIEREKKLDAVKPEGKSDVLATWNDFKEQQQLKYAKEKLEDKLIELNVTLDDCKIELSSEAELDESWAERRQFLEEKTNFLIEYLDKIDSMEDLKLMQGNAVKEIYQAYDSLYEQYLVKIEKVQEHRRRQEEEENYRRKQEEEENRRQRKLLTKQLLTKYLNSSMFPEHLRRVVPESIKEFLVAYFTIEKEEQALTAAKGLYRFAIPIAEMENESGFADFANMMWDTFRKNIKEEKGEYLLKLSLEWGSIKNELIYPRNAPKMR